MVDYKHKDHQIGIKQPLSDRMGVGSSILSDFKILLFSVF